MAATAPDGAKVSVPVVERVLLAGGVTQAEGSWIPAKAGVHGLACLVTDNAGAVGSATASGAVSASMAPVIASVSAERSAVPPGVSVGLRASASDPEGGALRYSWSCDRGVVAGDAARATWTAPAEEGFYAVEVTVTDDAGVSSRLSARVEVAATVLQGAAATLRGPRRVAATDDGSLFVADARGGLSKLTPRGDFVAQVLTGARSLAVGGGFVFVGTDKGELVKLHPVTARVLSRANLGVTPGPIGLSFDSARGELWAGYSSGVVCAMDAEGKVLRTISAGSAGRLSRLVDVAVDSAAGVVWVTQDRKAVGGMIFGFRVADGVQVQGIGADGSGPAAFAGALAVGNGGQLLVSDSFGGKVAVLGSTGAPVRTITSAGLRAPSGMAFMANGDLVVANMDADRLDRFGDDSPLPTCSGDADCDGILDADELAAGLDPNLASDALLDPDGDGLGNLEEILNGSNVLVADSDGDGFTDGQEVAGGFDPADGTDHTARLMASGGGNDGPGLVRLAGSIGGLPVEVPCDLRWQQVAGASVALSDAATLAPSFVVRRAGTYRFTFDGTCDGVPAVGTAVEVVIANVAPVADAVRTVVAEAPARLQLNGSASSDANGDAVRASWEQVSGTAVTGPVDGGVLSLPLIAQAGTYGLALTAADAGGAASTADVQVVVLGSDAVPAASVVSPVLAVATQTVALDASATFAGAGAVFAWQQVAGEAVSLSGQGSARASFRAPSAGRYAFQVAVQQGAVRSPPALVEVFVAPVGGALPVASAAAPSVAAVGAAVTLDGSASTGTAFAWRQVAGPAAGLRNANSPKADAFFFAPGSYVFELAVAEGAVAGIPARVRIEAQANGKAVPVAKASAQPEAVVGERVVLDGTGSVGAKSFRWTQVAGTWAVVKGGATAAFIAPAPGRYVFELEVDDGQARSAPARVEVIVVQNGMEN